MSQSRMDKFLEALLKGDVCDVKPQSRLETFFQSLITGEACSVKPKSRLEAYVKTAIDKGVAGGGSGGSGGNVNWSESGSAGSSTPPTGSGIIRYVTFKSYDGTVEYGRKACIVGEDCVDPVAADMMATPTRASTAQYTYTFSGGWATTPNGGKDSNALKNVTEDRVVYANFITATRYYTVSFYDGDTLLTSKQVTYGGSTTYTPDAKEGYFFDKWVPAPENITADTVCYAQWKMDVDFSTASWAEISAICEAGEAQSYFALGDAKEISYTYGGTQYNAIVEIVAFNYDNKSNGSGKAGITVCTTTVTPWRAKKNSNTTNPAPQWPNCEARTLFNTTIYNTFATDLKNAIKTVTKKTTGYSGTAATTFTTEDKVWIPSLGEVHGKDLSNNSLVAESAETFAKYTRNKSENYYLRTGLNVNNASTSAMVRSDGAIQATSSATSMGYVFGFCI